MSDTPARSLASYRAAAELRDGTPILVRAIRPDDKWILQLGLRRLSESTIYHRFFGAKKTLTDEELRYLTELDFEHHVGLLAVREEGGQELPLGVGRFIRIAQGKAPPSAEVAFTVADRWQGHGVATALLHHLVAIARRLGIARFEADVLPDNKQMLEVFEHSGLPMQTRVQGGVVHVALTL